MIGIKPFAPGKKNYRYFMISLTLILTGFLLMKGSSNTGKAFFNQDIYSFRRITLAPLVLLGGYCMMFLAILAKEKK